MIIWAINSIMCALNDYASQIHKLDLCQLSEFLKSCNEHPFMHHLEFWQ